MLHLANVCSESNTATKTTERRYAVCQAATRSMALEIGPGHMEFCQNDSDLHKTTQKTRDWGKKQTNTQYMQVSFVLHKLLTKVAPMCFQQQQQKQSQSLKIQLPFLFSPSKFWEESNHHPSHPRTQMRLPGFCGSQSAKCLSESHDTFRRFVRMPV